MDQIENFLKEIYADLAVVSNDHFLCILIDDDDQFLFKNIKKQSKQVSGLHQSKIKILTGNIPKSSNGKIQYQRILKEYFSNI